jgi:capsid protein
MVQPVWDAFVGAALGSNLIRVPIDIDPITLDDALFIGPSMPWIDPLKEAKGNVEMERAGYISGPEIIRRRGGNPRDVTEQESRWRRDQRQKELVSSADPAYDLGQQNDVLQNQSGSE